MARKARAAKKAKKIKARKARPSKNRRAAAAKSTTRAAARTKAPHKKKASAATPPPAATKQPERPAGVPPRQSFSHRIAGAFKAVVDTLADAEQLHHRLDPDPTRDLDPE
jgi:hypothetical protein